MEHIQKQNIIKEKFMAKEISEENQESPQRDRWLSPSN